MKLRPSEDELRVELANLYARAGWREQALEHYRHVLSVRPDHEGARHGLTAMGLRPGGSRD